MKISVIICSLGRETLYDTISSILDNKISNYEVIVVLQGNKKLLKEFKKRFPRKKINFYLNPKIGLSSSRNLGISLSIGDIVAFTDDDCIVDKKWLEYIREYFDEESNASGVFGNTFPYKKKNHSNLICPSTFNHPKKRIIKVRSLNHFINIGIGNNMAFKKKLFKHVGLFKTWLGRGSEGKSAEDSEFIYRVLKMNFYLGFDPKIKTFHNRWITEDQSLLDYQNNTFGFFTFFGYYFLEDNKVMLKFIIYHAKKEIFEPYKYSIVALIKQQRSISYIYKYFLHINAQFFNILRGFIKGMKKSFLY